MTNEQNILLLDMTYKEHIERLDAYYKRIREEKRKAKYGGA
tara:strand:- start:272 stop:394 length:123 start_codon:yes stop_codon:yes gene_type:complete